ncbi:MAG: tRNA (adenosine(37)-N6)-threonylcarbamoyltransferase complex ATPase subunit type 1 TsaE [Bdellovibrionales bacterium]|nr:tRNA (adenosine(37)-N6)-threonylcarbamoyltransferase complex ATPase subunit type 1 TsaE [Bdellovibrionales bacterium]
MALQNGSFELASLVAAHAWVKACAAELKRPSVVLLSGPLGAGKTQFVRWFLSEVGASEVASPTFAIHHEYGTAYGGVDHVDLYRVESDGDLEASGFWDLFAADQGLVFVEWADRLPEDVWPQSWQRLFLNLEKISEQGRRLTVTLKKPGTK